MSDFLERNHPRPVFRLGRWISVVVVAVIVVLIVNSLFTNPNYHWDKVWENLFHPTIIRGIGFTLLLTIAAMIIGVILAVTMAIMRQSPNPVLKSVAWFYIWFFRGTPIYTQLIFWGLLPTLYPMVGVGSLTVDINLVWNVLWAAILGLGLNEGAYLAEIVRAGLNSVDAGQWEAATALGMKRGLVLRRIIIPQAMRVIVPPTGNETISMLKTTSLVSAVPFTMELTFAAQALGRQSFLPVPMLICAAIWYLLITSILMVGQFYLEKYFGKGFNKGGNDKRVKRRVKEADFAEANPGAFLDVTP
ncbi:MAG: amino acid ABC transporter permease [Mobiluncus porci]|uniref:Amino acid ABC transporter permease n=1 Tax=Mobiluncus porci TaxID=2652278 RepID=A0A7K0K032_9ACTO|nr:MULTISPECIES: amino acid ABC transporter permease [Mobiluncus]MCI6585293.1 amino acid ABC transporter permease [Mobiluncus sp.]MDD7541496.1 amino acid ABC transporter permease [Mobiluncus porci]MDY5748481.1 amino acid ABC transporter permease [Mobiluncus porci]MST48759.1 amino acid ABC transporter permease [Mobiluncus porci]